MCNILHSTLNAHDRGFVWTKYIEQQPWLEIAEVLFTLLIHKVLLFVNNECEFQVWSQNYTAAYYLIIPAF